MPTLLLFNLKAQEISPKDTLTHIYALNIEHLKLFLSCVLCLFFASYSVVQMSLNGSARVLAIQTLI